MIGSDLIGIRSPQYNTIRYTIWPGSLGKLLLGCPIPEGFKSGDRVKLGAFNISPIITQQLIKHIGEDLMIAKSNEEYLKTPADHHWIMQEGGLWDDASKEWLVWE